MWKWTLSISRGEKTLWNVPQVCKEFYSLRKRVSVLHWWEFMCLKKFQWLWQSYCRRLWMFMSLLVTLYSAWLFFFFEEKLSLSHLDWHLCILAHIILLNLPPLPKKMNTSYCQMYLWDVILYMYMNIALFKHKLSTLSPPIATLMGPM